jgi:CRP/FNR family transcriptional regulator, cyclic AMP receptor protein
MNTDVANIVSIFQRHQDPDTDGIMLPGWGAGEWITLFSYTTPISLPAGSTLIQRDADERAFFFLVDGALEVAVSYGAESLGSLRRVSPGSGVGELSFFDGRPRSARVWAAKDSELRRLELGTYGKFANQHPKLANDLLFALGRLVALRLRETTARISRVSGGPSY